MSLTTISGQLPSSNEVIGRGGVLFSCQAFTPAIVKRCQRREGPRTMAPFVRRGAFTLRGEIFRTNKESGAEHGDGSPRRGRGSCYSNGC